MAKPTRLFVFDHDQALFGADPTPGAAIKRLESLSTRLGVSCGKVSGGNRHCLLDVVSSTEYFGEWIEAISLVPDRFLRIVCEEVINFGITADMAEHAYNFLRERKKGFTEILKKHQSEFTQITQWGIV